MFVVNCTDDMEPEESDGHLVEDHHLQIGVLIVITIHCHPEAWLFWAFPVAQTNLSKPTALLSGEKIPCEDKYACLQGWAIKGCSDLSQLVRGSGHSPEIRVQRSRSLIHMYWSLLGFPGELAQCLGKDATLQEVLWMLDEHYRVVMMFDAMNKELYMLHQGYQEGMSEYGVWLAWHVWIIQTEFPRCIRDEHLEGVKHDHFNKGLKEDNLLILGHKMEDEHPATYAELLKAASQIEKWSQARHPASQCSQSDGSSNVWASTFTSLFPSCRLKGNHLAVSGRAAAMDSDEDWDVGDNT